MLEVFRLVKQYKNFVAVNELDMLVRPGEIVGLLGPNGAGKTTAMRCCAGILKPTFGTIRINGADIQTDQAKAKAGLAFVPEVPSLYELLTVQEHLKFIAMCFNRLDIFEQQGEAILDRFQLLEKKNELVATLSKGMRQKLSVACALIHEANVFLFDEPLIGVDPSGARELKEEIIRQRDAGGTILISTHLLDTAEKLCDRVLIVNQGMNIAEGTLAELQSDMDMEGHSLEEVFLKLTEEGDEATAFLDD